jgi:His-Xaa-Ser system protein HxsD
VRWRPVPRQGVRPEPYLAIQFTATARNSSYRDRIPLSFEPTPYGIRVRAPRLQLLFLTLRTPVGVIRARGDPLQAAAAAVTSRTFRTHRTVPTGQWLDIGVDTESVVIDLRIYPIETVRRAAYSLTGDFSVAIEAVSDNEVRVTLRYATTGPTPKMGSFEHRLIDFRVRADLARDTAYIRDLIYRQAFVEADL